MNRYFYFTAIYDANALTIRFVILVIFIFGQILHISWFLVPLSNSNTEQSIKAYNILSTIWIIFSILWIWSYIVTCWLDAGSIETELYNHGYINSNGRLIENLAFPPEIAEYPLCEKCHLPKPPRTHHCSQCGLCYFRFDHHCEVVGNCIAYRNMKGFMLFLFYSSFLFFIAAITSVVGYVITGEVDLSYLITACILGVLVGGIICFFGIMYIPDVCVNNRTTLERIAGNAPNVYNAGVRNNIKQVFGECPLLWIVPTRPSIHLFD